MSKPTLIRSLNQESRESRERANRDQNRSVSPPTLFDRRSRRQSFTNPRYDHLSASTNQSDLKIWNEMTNKRQQKKHEKERLLREKLGLGEIRRNNIFSEDYVEKRPTTLSSLSSASPPSTTVPAWLQEAAARSDVTGLMGAYAKRKEVKNASVPERQNYVPQSRRTGGLSRDLSPGQDSEHPYQPQHDHQYYMNGGPGFHYYIAQPMVGNQEYLAYHPQHDRQYPYSHDQAFPSANRPRYFPLTQPQQTHGLYPMQPYQQPDNNQFYGNNNQFTTQAYPSNQAHPSNQPNFNQSTSNQPTFDTNNLPPTWYNGNHPSITNPKYSNHQASNRHQPFGDLVPDATSTPPRPVGGSHPGSHPSSTSSQQSSYRIYPNDDQRDQYNHPREHVYHPSSQTYSRNPGIPSHSSFEINGIPGGGQVPEPYQKTNEPHMRSKFHPAQTEISPAESSVPTLQGSYDGPTMTPISSYQVQRIYQHLHGQPFGQNQSSVPQTLQLKPINQRIDTRSDPHPNLQTDPLQPSDHSMQTASSRNDAPPSQLQQPHNEIMSLRKGKSEKHQEQELDHSRSLSQEVVRDLERMAEESSDELDLLRPEMLNVEDAAVDVSMSADQTRRSHHHTGFTNRHFHPRGHHSDDTEISDTSETETNTSLSSTEDDIYISPTPKSSYTSRNPSHSSHTPRSHYSHAYTPAEHDHRRLGRGRKRGRVTGKGDKSRKRPRNSRLIEYPISDDTDGDSDFEDYTYEDADKFEDDGYISEEIDLDQKMEASPRREPKPVKPLSAFADNVIIPSNISITRESKPTSKAKNRKINTKPLISSLKKTTNLPGKKKKVRFPSPAQIEASVEDIEGFSDEDEIMEDTEEDEIDLGQSQSISQPSIGHRNQNQGKNRGSEKRWLRNYEDGDRLSTVEEEDEEEDIPANGDTANEGSKGVIEEEGKAHNEEPTRSNERQEQEEEQVQFWGNGGDLGFVVWRDEY